MSDSKGSSSSSSSSGSASGGMKPSVTFLGDKAIQHVLKQMRFILNRPRHVVTLRSMSDSKEPFKTVHAGFDAENTSWRKDAKDSLTAPAPFGAGGTMGNLGPLYLSLSKPPSSGNCGEMAMLAYRKLISLAIIEGVPMAIALITVGDIAERKGNHSFVMAGTSKGWVTLLKPSPGAIGSYPLDTPGDWGTDVYVVDPWIDDGKCGTFRTTDQLGGHVSKWEAYVRRVAEQADDRVLRLCLGGSASTRIPLTVLDCIVISVM